MSEDRVQERPRHVVPPATSAGAESARRRIPTGIQAGFASNEAAEAWVAAGRPSLSGEPSGKNGYTVADVRSAAEEG